MWYTDAKACPECGSLMVKHGGVYYWDRCINCGYSSPESKVSQSKTPTKKLDLSVVCPSCVVEMAPIHSHYECPKCHWRDSCCF